MGWPSAMAPPCTLTLLRSSSSKRSLATETTANASLISKRSTSFTARFSLDSVPWMALAGAVVNHSGA